MKADSQVGATLQSSNFPAELRNKIAQFGITEDNYDRWVAGHEAAHAVVAIHHGSTIRHIGTSPESLGSSLSRAKCESTLPPTTPLATLDIIAAGPAYDQLHASDYGIPQAALVRVTEDRNTADREVFSKQNLPRNTWDGLWDQALQSASALLGDHLTYRKLCALQQTVFAAIRNATALLPGDEVEAIVRTVK